MITITYSAGSHGNLLEFLLNSAAGIKIDIIDDMIYDKKHFATNPIFFATHRPVDGAIAIRVNPESYMKFVAIAINRVDGCNLQIEDLEHDTFNKFKNHRMMEFFLHDLAVISGQTTGSVSRKFLREWLRLCFFANDGATLHNYLNKQIPVNPSYLVDFESFYDGSVKQHCQAILQQFGLAYHPVDFGKILAEFLSRNQYATIDKDIKDIVKSIESKQALEIKSSNIVKEAWIDNWLVDNYHIDPLLRDEWFTNTQQIIDQYQLQEQSR